ncbi:MAG: hypothetical protein AAGF60_05360 [Pseudomonadota bacterium]
MKICIATYAAYADVPWREDAWLAAALRARGCAVEVRDWQAEANWHSYDGIFVSSTWNIPSAPDAFRAWVAACQADGARRLINARAVLDLGIDKGAYWQVLGAAGDAVLAAALTPSRFARPGERAAAEIVAACQADWPGQALVFKPIVSADSLHAVVFDPSGAALVHEAARRVTTAEAAADRVAAILAEPHLGGVVAQPYLPGVERGEVSATFVGGQIAVATRKRPGFGPLPAATRVLEEDPATLAALHDLGARVHAVLGTVAATPVRLRLDLIPVEDGFRILEVEMVDPNCNFTILPEPARTKAVEALAAAIVTAAG